MIGKKYLLLLFIVCLCPGFRIFAFAVSDIELVPALRDDEVIKRTYIIDTNGNDTEFLKPGIEFSIFRNDETGTLNHVGVVKAISTGRRFCKAKEKVLSSTLKERNLDIENIARGDVAIPSYTIFSNVLFQNTETPVLTIKGLDIINNNIIPLINTESFTRIKINVYNDNGWSSDEEIELGKYQAQAVKRHLQEQFDIPSGFIDIESIGNLQNLYADAERINNSRVEILFLSGEKIMRNDIEYNANPLSFNSVPPGGFLSNNVSLQQPQSNSFSISEYPDNTTHGLDHTQIPPPASNENPLKSGRALEETKDIGDIILREE